jgi:hypothetical protein
LGAFYLDFSDILLGYWGKVVDNGVNDKELTDGALNNGLFGALGAAAGELIPAGITKLSNSHLYSKVYGGRGFNTIDSNSPMYRFGSHIGESSKRPFYPEEVGLTISMRQLHTDKVHITHRGVNKVENHLSRFGSDKQNQLQIERLRAIASNQLKPTQSDLNNYTHELREFLRYKKLGYEKGVPANAEDAARLWNNTHTATLEEYNLKEGFGVLYHPSTY